MPDKRQRLVEGARLLLHQQGVEKTTLADIAQAADVPVGNVYYYFKTKDELVQAAIDANAHDIQTMLASFDRHRTPKARLKALVRALTDQREVAALYGCPHGTLCSELNKRDDDLERAAGKLMQLLDRLGRAAVPGDGQTRRARPRGRDDLLLPGDHAANKHVPPTRAD